MFQSCLFVQLLLEFLLNICSKIACRNIFFLCWLDFLKHSILLEVICIVTLFSAVNLNSILLGLAGVVYEK